MTGAYLAALIGQVDGRPDYRRFVPTCLRACVLYYFVCALFMPFCSLRHNFVLVCRCLFMLQSVYLIARFLYLLSFFFMTGLYFFFLRVLLYCNFIF